MGYKPWFDDYVEEVKDTPSYVASGLIVEITDKFFDRMKELGLTQESLAKKLGFTQPYISKLLNHGANMTIQTLAKIAVALEMDVKAPEFTPKERKYDIGFVSPAQCSHEQDEYERIVINERESCEVDQDDNKLANAA
ncbi:MAG TPA: helix-turn-helix transcriptional regulator [bacterium]|nr:helix-turn-helix transcriptional regulator [bacterium]